MNCPVCSSSATRVVDSRTVEDGSAVRRRRVCRQCAERFTTFERIETRIALAINDNGETLLAGISTATGRRRPAARLAEVGVAHSGINEPAPQRMERAEK